MKHKLKRYITLIIVFFTGGCTGNWESVTADSDPNYFYQWEYLSVKRITVVHHDWIEYTGKDGIQHTECEHCFRTYPTNERCYKHGTWKFLGIHQLKLFGLYLEPAEMLLIYAMGAGLLLLGAGAFMLIRDIIFR